MTVPFDPYLEWLGIEGEGIPTHYELLALAPKESDRVVIQEGADARLAQVKSIRPGAHRAIWEQLIAYIEEVRAILLDPRAKAEYDATLPDVPPSPPRAPAAILAVPPGMPSVPSPEPPPEVPRGTSPPGPALRPKALPVGTPIPPAAAGDPQGPPGELPVGIPIGIPVGQTIGSGEDWDRSEIDVTAGREAGDRARRPLKPRHRGLSNNQLAMLFILGILVFGGLAYGILKIRQRDQERRVGERKPAPAAAPVEVAGKTHPLNGETLVPPDRRTLAPLVGKEDSPAELAIAQGGVETPASDSATGVNAAGGVAADAASSPPQSADSETDDARFQSLLNEARRRMGMRDLAGATRELEEARKLADTPERTARWDQVCSMRDLVQAFWAALGDELERRKNEPMSIKFNGGAAEFVVVECDRNRLVIRKEGETLTYDVPAMPHNLVVLMARNLLKQEPDVAAMTGAFIAMEPEGDREEARRLLAKAAETRDDLSRVLPELDVPRPRAPSESRIPVPADETEIARAQLKVKREFKDAYDSAGSGPKQLALAKTLREAAVAEQSDRMRQFVLFDDAVRFAVAAGALEDAFSTVDAMGRVFAIDSVEKKTAVLGAVARGTVGVRRHRELVPLALELAREAAMGGRANQLERILESAKDSARKTGSAGTMKEVMEFETGLKKRP